MNCLDIITRAYKRIGVTAGDALPRPAEQEDALKTLRSIYTRLIHEGAFGVLSDVMPAGPAYTAGENERIMLIGADDVCEITMPDTVAGCGGPRAVRHGAVVKIIDQSTTEVRTYIRDANVAQWIDVDDLTPTTEAPFSAQDALGLSCFLAMHLADEFGQQASPTTVSTAMQWQYGLTHSWSEEPTTTRPDYF